MNIYVGNLSWGASEQDLFQAFSAYGEVVSAKIVTDKITGRSRGFGFVEMPDEVAQAAIDGLNGREVMGLALRVNEARPKTEGTGGGGGGYRDNNRSGGGGGYKKREY